ncbi:MAG TPA: MarR family winged helix-turn-helix transcriptional regulator [Sphingomicrobium sp.]|nr:MarR family winged helix-turn-helix transcriptional regulator [Sphingomicrobium sp.]
MIASARPQLFAFGEFADAHPVLIVASSAAAHDRAAATIDAFGYRKVALTVEEAPERLLIQPAASAVWVELDEDAGTPLDRLMDQVNAEAGTGRCPAIISAPMRLLDRVEATVRQRSIELVIDGSELDRGAALATAIGRLGYEKSGVAEDVSRESGAARLRQLSDEVSRIAATLARLSVAPGAVAAERPEPVASEAPQISIDQVRQVIRARRLRARFFDEELFADPAWDMLLDLLQAEIAQHRVPVSSLCIAAAVPATTALRWIKSMTDSGLFKRRADPHDGRRVFVELSSDASDAMRRYFKEVGKVAVV